MKLRFLISIIPTMMALSSCNQAVDAYGNGVGTELSYSSLGHQTAAQDSYVAFICRQAGAPSGTCSVNWNDFVLAGMNDIDARCDAYLSWLDSRRRWNGPIQKQIADTQTATTTIMAATGASGTAIGIVAAAFGLTRNSFDNAQSRLLMEVNHSTVQTIVLSSQDRFRKEVTGINVSSRPIAIYILRQYLRLCMPYTIENEINTTITTYQLGGARALENAEESPLIQLASLKREAVTPPQTVQPPPPVDLDNQQYRLVARNPGRQSTLLIRKALAAVCATPAEIEKPTAATVTLVKVMQQWRKIRSGMPNKVLDGKMDDGDLAVASIEPACTQGVARNFYEMKEFPKGIGSASGDLIDLLNSKLPDADKLPADASENVIREGIAKVRSQMTGVLELQDPSLSHQLTLELIEKL